MGYIGNQNIIERIGQAELILLTDNSGANVVDPERVNQAIDYASGVFDAYVPVTYLRPISATPLVLSINLDLALYDFWKDKAEMDEGKWKVRKVAHDDALKILQAINKGTAVLDSPLVVVAGEVAAGSVPFIFVTLDDVQ